MFLFVFPSKRIGSRIYIWGTKRDFFTLEFEESIPPFWPDSYLNRFWVLTARNTRKKNRWILKVLSCDQDHTVQDLRSMSQTKSPQSHPRGRFWSVIFPGCFLFKHKWNKRPFGGWLVLWWLFLAFGQWPFRVPRYPSIPVGRSW